MSLFQKVPVSLSEFQHDVTTSVLTEFGRKLYQTSILYVRDCRAHWVRGLEPTGLGGSGGAPLENLKLEFLNGWKFNAVPVRFACHCYANKRTTDGNVSSRAEWVTVETGENTEFAVGSSLISFTVGNSQQRVVACRHFVALVSLFQGRVACRNLPLTGPLEWYSQLEQTQAKLQN